MNVKASLALHSVRTLALAAAAAVSLIIGAESATASVKNTTCDTVGSGTGSAEIAGTYLEELGLVPTSGPAFAVNDGPTLVGSGPEREVVAVQPSAPTLTGSGPEREEVAKVAAPVAESAMYDHQAIGSDAW